MEKTRYAVYQIDRITDGWGKTEMRKKYIGDTYAVSEAKAINNLKYRLGIKPGDLQSYYVGDGGSITTFCAEKN